MTPLDRIRIECEKELQRLPNSGSAQRIIDLLTPYINTSTKTDTKIKDHDSHDSLILDLPETETSETQGGMSPEDSNNPPLCLRLSLSQTILITDP